MKRNTSSLDLLDERSQAGLPVATSQREVGTPPGNPLPSTNNDAIALLIQEDFPIASTRPLLQSAGYYLHVCNFLRNSLVTFALIGEWFHDLFEVLTEYDRAPSKYEQQTWVAPLVLGIATVSSAAAEILNYRYAKKNPGRALGADETLSLLFSGPLFFLAYELFFGADVVPLWCFATISSLCFGAFLRKSLSASLDANHQLALSFEAFDRLERKAYTEATLAERLINAARIAAKAALSSSAVITTLSREITGETKKLNLWEYAFVFWLIGATGSVGFDQTHIPKKVDIAVALLAGFEMGAWAYWGMSGLLDMSVVRICAGDFCANDWQRDLLISFSLMVMFLVGRDALKKTRLNFVEVHDDNIALIEAPRKTLNYLREKKELISDGCGTSFDKAKTAISACTGAGFKYAREMVSRCCATQNEAPDEARAFANV